MSLKRKKIFQPAELESYSLSLKANANYRMKDPQGLCRERAYLLAENLIEKGYAPQLMLFSSSEQGQGFKVEFNKKVFSYDHHWVVLLTDSGGKQQVLVPQFSEKNSMITDYLRLVSPPLPVVIKQKKFHYLTKRLEFSEINKSCDQLQKEIHIETLKKVQP